MAEERSDQSGRVPLPEDSSAVARRIEERALEVFASKGYHAAPVREILEAAGVSAPTLYYHFGSKEGLYRHLLDDLIGRMQQRVIAARAVPGGIRAQLVAMLSSHVEALLRRPAEIRFLHQVILGQLNRTEVTGQVMLAHRGRNELQELLREAIVRGELADVRPELLLNAFIGAFKMYVMHRLVPGFCPGGAVPDPCTMQELTDCQKDVEQIVDLFLDGAAVRKAEAS